MAIRDALTTGVARRREACYHTARAEARHERGPDMQHGRTSSPERIATSILEFARMAAESRIMTVRGDVSTPVPLASADHLSVVSPLGTIDLIGLGRDAAYAECDLHEPLTAMLSTMDAAIHADGMVFPLHGTLSVRRPTNDVLIVQCDHVRSDGRRSGAVFRLMLIVDRSHGLVLGQHG
jgi:hypothetical protein